MMQHYVDVLYHSSDFSIRLKQNKLVVLGVRMC